MIKIKLEKLKKEHIPSIMEIESVSFGKYHWSKDSFLAEIDNKLAHYYVFANKKHFAKVLKVFRTAKISDVNT